MIKLYKIIEQWWFKTFSDKMRFLLVGGFNTLVSYLLFLGFNRIFRYETALVLTYLTAINLSIFTMRYYVFAVKGNLAKQYSKALITYGAMIILNYAFLYLVIDIAGQPAWLAQAEYTILSTIGVYIMHKKVNFR